MSICSEIVVDCSREPAFEASDLKPAALSGRELDGLALRTCNR